MYFVCDRTQAPLGNQVTSTPRKYSRSPSCFRANAVFSLPISSVMSYEDEPVTMMSSSYTNTCAVTKMSVDEE